MLYFGTIFNSLHLYTYIREAFGDSKLKVVAPLVLGIRKKQL